MIQLTVVLCPKVLVPCHCFCFSEFEAACAIISIFFFLIIYIGNVGKARRMIALEIRALLG